MADGTEVALGLDVGGTNLRAALVTASGMVVEQRRLPSPPDGEVAFLDAVLDLHGDLTASLSDPKVPVGVGIASLVVDRRKALYGPNLGIGDLDIVAGLDDRGIEQVVVENDATVAMYGEWRVGAARGHDHAVMVTLGTGVGGGVVVDGRLLRGANGFASEVGHQPVQRDGRRCACGRRGCLEAYAAGSAIAVEAAERLASGAPSSLTGQVDLSGQEVVAAAEAGDALAVEVLEEIGTWLGLGLVGLVNLLDPSIVVVGGGAGSAAAARRHILPVAEQVVAAQIEGAAHRTPPPVVPGLLGDDAGIVGAALLALDEAGSR